LIDWFSENTKLAEGDSSKIDQKRLSRISDDLKEHLGEYLFYPVTRDIACYVQDVLENLKGVLCKELDLRMEEIRSHAIVEKFGDTRKRIEANIQQALKKQPKIEHLASHQGRELEDTIQNLKQEINIYLQKEN
jgi:hypothetical protein